MVVYTGLLEDYTRRGEWHDFKVAGKKVGTKRLDVAEKAMALLGQQVQADVFEKDSKNVNPNTGQPYVDRYLEQVVPAAPTEEGVRMPGPALPEFMQKPAEPNIPMEALTQADSKIEFGAPAGTSPTRETTPPPAPGPDPDDDPRYLPRGTVPPPDEREMKIMRQTATKVAVQLLAYASAENQKPENLIALADWLVNYYRFGSTKETYE